MSNEFQFKSYCWSMGTTSFRTKNFNLSIEKQLKLLSDFWSLEENENEKWSGNNDLQTRYYDYLKENDFLSGKAKNKPKDARAKTSGLVDIGLIDDNRHLTEAGEELVKISLSNDFSDDNQFQIAKDSYIYLKQLLKTSCKINEETIRPFVILCYLLNKFDFLTFDEFKYLLPLCIGKDETEEIANGISELRDGKITIDQIIINRLMNMINYDEALKFFLKNTVSKESISTICLNRKSSTYDEPYLYLYNALFEVYVNKKIDKAINAYEATSKISLGSWWRGYLFGRASKTSISREPKTQIKATLFDSVSNETEFKSIFFKVLHLFKAKATLSDYFDLNCRYFKTTNLILSEERTLKFDLIPKYFFKNCIDKLYIEAFAPSNLLYKNCSLIEISDHLQVSNEDIIKGISTELGITIPSIEAAQEILEDKRYERLQKLIDAKFTDEKLQTLLEYFKNRNDEEIRDMTTDNADVPTIFEYVLGILWYKVSERKGKILSYMKAELDADLLPVTHALGGEADIVYEYEETEYYPKHSLLLEATLASNTNQRRMEMEPVSRHLGNHLLRDSMNSYCVFATTYLDINVLADFRSRKTAFFYETQDKSKYVTSMKIIPLDTDELKKIIIDKKTYKELYSVFDEAFNSSLPPHEWSEKCIDSQI